MLTVFKRGETRVAMTVTCGTRRRHVGFDVATDFCDTFPTFAFLFSFPCRLDAACGGEITEIPFGAPSINGIREVARALDTATSHVLSAALNR